MTVIKQRDKKTQKAVENLDIVLEDMYKKAMEVTSCGISIIALSTCPGGTDHSVESVLNEGLSLDGKVRDYQKVRKELLEFMERGKDVFVDLYGRERVYITEL